MVVYKSASCYKGICLINFQVLTVQADVRDPQAIKAAADKCEEKFGLPHIVINNAAGNFISPTERLSSNAWKTVVDIVLNGTAYVTFEFGKRMIAEKKGNEYCWTTRSTYPSSVPSNLI